MNKYNAILSKGLPSEMKLLETWTIDEYYTLLQADIQIKEAEAEAHKAAQGNNFEEPLM